MDVSEARSTLRSLEHSHVWGVLWKAGLRRITSDTMSLAPLVSVMGTNGLCLYVTSAMQNFMLLVLKNYGGTAKGWTPKLGVKDLMKLIKEQDSMSEVVKKKADRFPNVYYRLEGRKIVPSSIHGVKDMWNSKNKTIAQTKIGDLVASTVFLIVNHNYHEEDNPVLFETMVFGTNPDGTTDFSDIYCERYATYDEAIAGHIKTIIKINTGEILYNGRKAVE